MKTISKRYAISIISFTFATICLFSQQVNTMYFMDNNPYRNKLNASFQPLSNVYIGFPIVGYSQYGLGNNALSLTDIFNLDGSIKDFVSMLKKSNQLRTDIDLNLFSLGFRTGKSYWNLTANQRFDFQASASKSLIDAATNGTTDKSYAGFDLNIFTEAGLGYSRKFGEKFQAGLKLKMLVGEANMSLQSNSFYFKNASNKIDLNNEGFLRTSSPLKINGLEVPDIPALSDFVKPSGIGAAVDLGVSYEVIKNLNLSAALNDLGSIKWTNNAKTYIYSFSANQLPADAQGLDSVANYSSNFYTLDSTQVAYSNSLMPKLNIGVEYGFFENKISLGLLSRSSFYKKSIYNELTASLNLKPLSWFDLSGSYSFLNGRSSNIGAGMGLRLGMLYMFATADYIPLNFKDKISSPDLGNIPAINTSSVNLALGFSFVFGNKQDKDKDGVSNGRDKCPDTPHGVIVDKKGCPLDTDGDGIPDYLDKCPDTPKEAYNNIDADGCPIDSDGDGVFDYADKCPETVPAAYGKVDENGCPLDTDKDSIADYLDKCADTPAGVAVDSLGCPLDEDKDNVPDYLDKCPGTPLAALGLVDENGCPLDSDADGVADYLDLCPNTIAEARANVDKNGCPKDTDQDGVADYLDKCPDTPIEAKGTVDEKGCPRDTDGDGVLDYLDNCPRLAGVASNRGCPEIKKEIRQLFQKALQGIQFETGKSTIKPVSFKILNDVAKVLSENPTYLIEIQGHTDNVGKKDANQILSDNRAKAVREYLINKGIDAKRMTANGYGDTRPVLPNTTKANKAKNRRVEFVVSFEEVKIVTEE
ncbi:MAG: hypothetical protein AUK44_08715 [Porphyromonadaceae bacterium CG2_30_38_12]|nr:MAG: hypothetical protein AUK44_08715 [Porphyromonadaceae bacterium CG2_30_38_12]